MSVVIDGSNGVDIGAGNLTFPDNTTQTTAPLDIGVSQTWQDVKTTPGRALATTYTNNTGKPIQVMITGLGTPGGGILSFSINGTVIGQSGTGAIASGSSYPSFNVIIPNGATYSCTNAGTCVLFSWWELR